MPHAPFVHLRVRSSYSLLEGAIDYQGLARACAADGMPAVAVTDHANLFGVMQFCAAAMAQGVQPIVGALLPLGLPSHAGQHDRDAPRAAAASRPSCRRSPVTPPATATFCA
jgi:DNA polymerase III subunit alpha